MTDADALLAAIAAHPDEDTPRLAYADWLDENERSIRAEFIRLQCEIARKEKLPTAILNQHVELFKRNQELIENHREELLETLSILPRNTPLEFHRGFVFTVELPVSKFLKHAATIAEARPRPKVSVKSIASRLSRFVVCPYLDCVTTISGHSWETGSTAFWPDDDALIAAIGKLTSLEVLDLEGCGISNLYWNLGFNFKLPALVDLDLSHNEITDAGVVNLLQTGLPRQLRRLILGGNPIGDRGAIELAQQWPRENRLEHLNMQFTNIGPLGQQALRARFGDKIELF
jgi:uncharacterized protein (TIGR02996 family)